MTSSGADPAEPCAGTIGLRADPAWLSCAARRAVVLLPRVGTLQKLKNCIFGVIFFFFFKVSLEGKRMVGAEITVTLNWTS